MVTIESFGYLHGLPAGDGLLVDLRDRIRDPHIDPAMRQMTGLNDAVYEHVLATPGAREIVTRIVEQVAALCRHHGDARVLIGCQGGRHRSVAVARAVDDALARHGLDAEVFHHHVTRDVVHR
jgi:UPF0042 nucleotide-binding protein